MAQPAPLSGANSTRPNLGISNSVWFRPPPPVQPQHIRNSSQPPPASWPTMITPELEATLVKMEQRIGVLEVKSLQDNLMMAALKEDQDTEANKAMLDRLTILGIKVPNIRKMTDQEKIPALKSKVEGFVEILLDEGQTAKVVFVRHLNRKSRNPDLTVLEVKFEDAKQAGTIRSNFIKKRGSPELGDINVTPTVRLATRVRVELLIAIAEVLKKRDPLVTKTQCLQYTCKPVLKVFRKNNAGNEFPSFMTFIDCVLWVKENNCEDQLELKKAYERAGSAFRGSVSQHFVVMS